ncbi:MAG TPA: hypothetical protein VIL20_18745 [Sandaracinaceae bacterium]
MYLSRHDARAALAVWILDRPTMDEWRRFTLDVVRVSQWPPSRAPLVLFVAEHFAPDRVPIEHFSDLVASDAFAARVAVVMVGALSQGLRRVLGNAPNVGLFDDVEDALEWLGARRPEGSGPLRALWRAANLDRPPQRMTEPG